MENQTTGPKVVKRYTNRKLYDTEESKYITLKQLVEVISAGREIQVVDNKTKTDITGQTLLQALVETEPEVDTGILHNIIKTGGINKYVANVFNGGANFGLKVGSEKSTAE